MEKSAAEDPDSREGFKHPEVLFLCVLIDGEMGNNWCPEPSTIQLN